jgi:hypothetical protein
LRRIVRGESTEIVNMRDRILLRAAVRVEERRVARDDVTALASLGIDHTRQHRAVHLDHLVRVRHETRGILRRLHASVRQHAEDQDDRGRQERRNRPAEWPELKRWTMSAACIGWNLRSNAGLGDAGGFAVIAETSCSRPLSFTTTSAITSPTWIDSTARILF